MDGNLGLTGTPLLIVKAILTLVIVAGLTFLAYMWWVAIPEQQEIIQRNEYQMEQLKR